MTGKLKKDKIIFEVMLLVVVLGMAFLLFRMELYKVVILNLFYLPIVLSGYFMGRGSAGILALFSAIAVSIVATFDVTGFSGSSTPLMVGLVLVVWAATLGLTAILVGTLSDERAVKIEELHEAYIGVVDVLATYLHSADPRIKARSARLTEICQQVAEEMHLRRQDMDDIRVAALLHDVGDVEITTRMISRAVDTLEARKPSESNHTFLGADLLHSLGTVLHRAVPLVLNQDDAIREAVSANDKSVEADMPIGARIIRVVWDFVSLTTAVDGRPAMSPQEAMRHLRGNQSETYDQETLDALENVLDSSAEPRGEKVVASIS
jgi:HD-GYP domain-containing protein (c-di-GMP phosphodiesterase class II)